MVALVEDGGGLEEVPTGSTVDQLRAIYKSNGAIADAAGLPTSSAAVRAYRAKHPRARRSTLERISAESRKSRQSFLQGLRRYEAGRYTPNARNRRRLDAARNKGVRERLAGLTGVARRFVSEGVGVAADAWEVTVSQDTRDRGDVGRIGLDRYLDQSFVDAVAERNWDRAASIFFDQGWSRAYMGIYATVETVSGLNLRFGLEGCNIIDGVDQRRRRSA